MADDLKKEEKKTSPEKPKAGVDVKVKKEKPKTEKLSKKQETGVSKYALKKKKKKIRRVTRGKVYIASSYNNTIITLTDLNGNVLVWSSAGQVGFKGPKKATPYAAGIIAKNVMDKVEAYGLKEVDVYLKGIGVGREAAVRGLQVAGLEVLSVKDVTPVPHNGCRPPRPRRV
jgi:small subunit ribosomal protein S11